MLIIDANEVRLFLPTSVQDSADSLLTLMEDAEETYLIPVLGRPLFDYLNEEYKKISQTDEWLLPKNEKTVPPVERLIRLCQEVVVSMVLANNAGLFSVSMNGAGLNTASAAGYDEADEKKIDRFVKDAFKKGHRAIDRLLLFLEEDAQNNKVDPISELPLGRKFTELWKHSAYFFQSGATLFATASEFNNFVYIDGSREWFVKLIPDIRFCQDNYIVPAVGEELVANMIASLTDVSVVPAGHEKIWDEALRRLRVALAFYTEQRNDKLRRKTSMQDANLALERCVAYLVKHGEELRESMADAPFMEELDNATTRNEDGSRQMMVGMGGDADTVHTLFVSTRAYKRN